MSLKVTRNVANRKVDVAHAIDLALRGVGTTDIARMMGVSRQAILKVIQHVKRLLLTPEQAKTFDDVHNRLIKGAMLEFIRAATDPGKLKKMPSRDAVWGYGVLFDKSRLLEGKSTVNLSSILRVQQAALAKTIEQISVPTSDQQPQTTGNETAGDVQPANNTEV